MTTLLLIGTQIGTMLSADAPAWRLQYTNAVYVADAPSFWHTQRLTSDVQQPAGDVTI